jgi:hypothetical protein
MYPQCRHVRPSSDRCHAAAIKGSHWCYFHERLHDQQAQREAQEQERRSRDARQQPRLNDGTFAPPEETIAQGTYLVPAPQNRAPHPDPEYREGEGWEVTKAGSATNPSDFPLQLPAVEDSASI